FSLSSMGDQVYLFSGDAQTNLTGYVHGFEFAAQINGVTFGRYVTSIGAERYVAQNANTLGSANAGPLVRPIVINEIMYHPPDVFVNGAYWSNSEDEFIELFNRGDAPVYLFDPGHATNTWKVDKAVQFEFPANVVLPAGGYLLVVNFDPVRNPTQLAACRSKYNVPAGAQILGPYGGNLSNGAEALALYMPDAPEPIGPNAGQVPWVLVERVRYSDELPWPVAADGLGHSLHRKNAAQFGDDPANWESSVPTPGRTYTPGIPPIITSQPQSQTVFASQTAALSVSATDPGPLRFQWRFNGKNILGATNDTLVLTNVQPAAAGRYAVVLLNPSSSAVSSTATLAVIVAAQITQQPQSQTVRPGTNVTFTVVASSTTPISYQWRINGLNIAKAANSSLTISNVQPAHEGDYTVMVTDGVASVPSATATLTVLVYPTLSAPVQPLLITATVGQEVTLGAETGGTLPMRYLWRHVPTSRLLANVVLNSHYGLLSFIAQADSGGAYTLTLTNAAYSNPNLTWTNWFVTVLIDTDNDGLPDSWETAHGLNPNSPPNDLSDANGDADGDGMKNFDEYVAGTNPNDPASYLKVDLLDGGGPASLSFRAASNRTYTVQYRDGLGIAQWQKLLDVVAQSTNFTATVTDSGASSSRYYRLLTPAQP
ncbi:MAG: immunoglobulin domain-containing protein, partial [Chloroflexi bacterium]|nr:immunoglobulin domain-containing protein [Chloroflexota bacterium]